jgi:serine/threonine protein kinase
MESFTYSHQRSYRHSVHYEDELGRSLESGSGQAAPSRSSQSSFDKQRILAKKGARVLSSMSDLLVVLAKSGIPGPKDLKALNLDGRAIQIGSGSQFTVFKNHPSAGGLASKGYSDLEGLVVKRVKMTCFHENEEDLVESRKYRRHLMSLELEIIALCHPGIQKNRNIVRVISWGRDYLDPETPLPVLFVEAARCSLDEFLDKESRWDIKYQLALDTSSGLEVLHKYHIVHGDMKPENILVFEQHNPKVPFVAKLSDFGLCIDLFNSKSELRIDDYLGTRDWNAPELLKKNQFEIITGTSFDPMTMLKFDTYSYGLVLVSIFCTKQGVSRLNAQEGTRAEAAVDLMRERLELPSSLKLKLCLAARGLLDDIPSKRPPPSPELLRIDELISYQDW